MNVHAIVSAREVEAQAEEAAALLRALSHPMRLRLVCALLEDERGVGELERLTGIRQPSLSKELGKLREAGLIEGRRESKSVFYSLIDARAAAVLAALCGNAAAEPAGTARTDRSLDKGSVFARILPPQD